MTQATTAKSTTPWMTITAFAAAWIFLAANAIRVANRDAVTVSLEASRYGENVPGELPYTLASGAIECVVLLFILFPWRRVGLFKRTAIAFMLYLLWAFFGFVSTMHAGSIAAIITFWRFGVLLLLLVIAMSTGFHRSPPSVASSGRQQS